MELPQRYDPHEAEKRWQAFWQEEKLYAFPDGEGEVYSVDTPPPTVSGVMHLGHAFSYAQQDYVVRYHRMKGERVFYPFGTDDNGLPTDRLVEKTQKVRSRNFKRDEYRKLALKTVRELKADFVQDWIGLGMSCDFDITYSTIDEHCQRTGQKSFLDLHKKGLIYRAETPVAWCPTCQTAIAQAEFDNVEMTSHFNDIIFKAGEQELVIATTRPELIPACVGVFAHPSDSRYAKFKGKFATIPLFNYEVPILFDESVEMEKGTGLMMVCTFGDKEDVEKWQKYKLALRVVLTEDGRLNELAPGYEGLKIVEARKKILADLKEAGTLVAQQQISHAVNVHERCNTEVEYLKKPQWFINILDHKEELLEIANKINWYPPHMKVRYEHWVQNLHTDWCISRQRFYGVPFPVWYKGDEIVLADEVDLPVDPTTQPKDGCVAEEDTMDTWNISSCSPQIVLDWAEKTDRMDLFPMTMRPQAHDIIRTWAFYTIVKGLYHHKQIPWKDIVISGHVLDPKGNKMSKSKGNAIAPQDIVEKYSSDALRYWAAGVKLGDDLPFMEKDVQTGQKTITKLWNAMKFAISHLQDYDGFEGELHIVDRWLLSRFNKVVQDVTDSFEVYEYSKSRFETDKFFWQTFCDNYLELVKDRLYNIEAWGDETLSAKHTLYSVGLGILKLFAPIMPHITEELYHLYFKQHDNAKSIHVAKWPTYRPELIDEEAEIVGAELVKVIAEVRKYKSSKQLSMKAELAKLKITTKVDIRLAEQDLLAVTGAKTLEHKKGEFSVEIE